MIFRVTRQEAYICGQIVLSGARRGSASARERLLYNGVVWTLFIKKIYTCIFNYICHIKYFNLIFTREPLPRFFLDLPMVPDS